MTGVVVSKLSMADPRSLRRRFPESGPKKNSRFSGDGPTKNRDPEIRV